MTELHRPPSSARRSDAVSWTIVVVHTVTVFGAVYAAVVLAPSWLIVPLWLWFGLTLNGYLNLMHECSHGLTFRRRATSTFLGRWVLGPLVLADFDGYRDRHWDHHKYLGMDGDTKDAYLIDIRGFRLLKLVLRCLLLQEAARKFAHQARNDAEEQELAAGRSAPLLRVAAVQVIFLGSVSALAIATHGIQWSALAAVAIAYMGVYLYGVAALTVLAANLRAIAEHQLGYDHARAEGRAALRNLAANPASRLVFGAYGFAEHATHHGMPGVPYYRLSAATESMGSEDASLNQDRGYVRTLWALSRQRRPIESAA